MTHHEPDVLAVRSLAEEPSDESVTRAWYRITQLEAKRHNVSRRRFLIPVAAGVALTVLAGGTAFFLTRGAGDDGGHYLPGTKVEIASALDALAAAAEQTTPLSIPDGKLIYTEIDGWAAVLEVNGTTGRMQAQPREMWFEPNGGTLRRLEENGVDMLSGAKAQGQSGDSAGQPDNSPGLRQPTLAWIAGLPTDSQQLLALLRDQVGTSEKWSVDQQVWDAMGTFYTSHEIALSPQSRAALLRSFKGIKGLKAREITLDGRALVAIRFIEGDHGDEILFDPVSGRAVGRSSLYFGPLQLTQPDTGAVADPNVTYVATWIQQIVDPL